MCPCWTAAPWPGSSASATWSSPVSTSSRKRPTPSTSTSPPVADKVRPEPRFREVGESPTRSRHCDRGANPTTPLGSGSGRRGERRSGSQETDRGGGFHVDGGEAHGNQHARPGNGRRGHRRRPRGRDRPDPRLGARRPLRRRRPGPVAGHVRQRAAHRDPVPGRPVLPRVLPRRTPHRGRALPLTPHGTRTRSPNMLARLDFTRPRTIVAAAVLIGYLAGLFGGVLAHVHTVHPSATG